MKKKIITLIKMVVLSVGLILLFRTITDNKEADKKVKYNSGSTQYGFSMGTSVSATLYGDALETKFKDIMELIDSLDKEYISWRNQESELGKLNNCYVCNEKYFLSDILYDAIHLSWNICNDSEGALDITIRPLAQVWNIEEADSDSFEVPKLKLINEALEKVGYEKLSVRESSGEASSKEGSKGYILISQENMIIDLGAVGKGYALDILRNWLSESDIDGACISVGGSILVYGEKADGSNWRVGIRNPQGTGEEMIGYLELPPEVNVCVSTSGDYEKFFIVDDVKYHHILDRTTGKPSSSEFSSVTVVCENGLASDALSTACFVLGYDKSLALLEKYGAEAIFIDHDNNIILTEGLKDIFIKK